jgi:hypothetical protein
MPGIRLLMYSQETNCTKNRKTGLRSGDDPSTKAAPCKNAFPD